MTDNAEDSGQPRPDCESEAGESGKVQQIRQLYGKLVTVTNPDFPDAPWTGILTGRYDEPVVTLAVEGGADRALPQRFDITEAKPDDEEILARYAEELPGMSIEVHGPVCGNCQAGAALASMREALRCVLLPWLEDQGNPITARRLRHAIEDGLDEVEDQIDIATCG